MVTDTPFPFWRLVVLINYFNRDEKSGCFSSRFIGLDFILSSLLRKHSTGSANTISGCPNWHGRPPFPWWLSFRHPWRGRYQYQVTSVLLFWRHESVVPLTNPWIYGAGNSKNIGLPLFEFIRIFTPEMTYWLISSNVKGTSTYSCRQENEHPDATLLSSSSKSTLQII